MNRSVQRGALYLTPDTTFTELQAFHNRVKLEIKSHLAVEKAASVLFQSTKGQLISEAIFLGFKSPKKQKKIFEGFLPKPLKWVK